MLKFPVGSPEHRRLVLSLYRKILRDSHIFHDWREAVAEASEMFHNNMHETDPKKVSLFIQEAEARYELAMHYKIWRPRQTLFPREGYETAQDATISNPTIFPVYMASEYIKEIEEAEKYAEYRKKLGTEPRIEYDDEDENKW